MDSADHQLFDLGLEDLSMDLQELSDLMHWNTDFDLKKELNSVGSPNVDSPLSPSSLPPSPSDLDPRFENVFLDESAMGLDLRDPDQVDSQVQELMYIANQVDNGYEVAGTQTEVADSTTDVKPVVIVPANEVSVPKVDNKAKQIFVFPESTIPVNSGLVTKMKSSKRTATATSPYHKVSSSHCPKEISDDELISLSVKDLNRMLQGLPRDAVANLKQRRRTLKNRGYAANSREKRNTIRSELEDENKILAEAVHGLQHEAHTIAAYQEEVARLRQEMEQVKAERDRFKKERDHLMAELSAPCSPDLFEA